MRNDPNLSARNIWRNPGILLLIVLLSMCALIFVWWPADVYFAEISLVAWLMLLTLPISVGLTGIYVLWMEHREKRI